MRLADHRIVLACLGIPALASIAQAAPIVYEPFNYAAASNIGTGTAPDADSMGLTGNWNASGSSNGATATLLSGSIGDTLAPTTSDGNSVQLNSTASGSDLIYEALASNVLLPSDTSHGTLFISFVLQLSSASTGVAQMQLTTGGTGTTGVNIGFNSGSNSSHFGFNPGGTTFLTTATPNTTTSVNPTLLVVELDYAGAGADTAKLYVHPSSTGATADYTSAHTLTLGPSAISRMAFLTTEVSSTATVSTFDEVRIGTTFADVIGVPEPASIGIIGALGAVALLGRRRSAGQVQKMRE